MLNKPKILIVDDKVENLVALETILSDLNVSFIRALSGNEALKKTLEHDFVIALVDVQMPDMDGFETIELMRQEKRTRDMPVIFISAVYKEAYHQIKGIETGAVDFIAKPIVPEILVGKVRVFLRLYENKLSMENEISLRKQSETDLKHLNEQLKDNLEQLQASEERFRSLVTTIPDVIYRIDPEGNFIFINDAIKRLGYEPKELLSRHFSEIISPADVESVDRSKVLSAYKGKVTGNKNSPKLFDERRSGTRKTTGLKIRLLRKYRKGTRSAILQPIGHETVAVDINSAGLYEANYSTNEKMFIGTVGVIRDISDRKQMEEDLKESEDRLRTIFDATDAGIVLIDPETHCIVDVNPAASKMMGIEKKDIIGSVCHQFICPTEKGKCPITDLEQRVDSSERELLNVDGKRIPILKTVDTIWLNGRKHLLESFVDISKLKQVEEELNQARDELEIRVRERTAQLYESNKLLSEEVSVRKEAEHKYRTLVENASEAIIVVQDEIIKFANPKAEELFNCSQEELISKRIVSFIHEEDRTMIDKQDKIRIKDEGTIDADDFRIIDKNKNVKWVELNGVLFDWKEAPAILCFIADITERKKFEQQIAQTQKVEAIGTLTSGIAHDFNNILTTIIGNAHLLLEDIDKEDSLYEEIEEIKAAGERAASLTRQLLAFGRKQIIQPRALNLNDLLTDLEKMIGRLIREDIELKTILNSQLWLVKLDPGQMEQIIINLVVNASDAMPNGGKLTIETENMDVANDYFRMHGIEEDRSGDYVMLAISDTGIGMDKEILERIYDPFFTTKDVGEGTGLGLSTVYGIVKQNNGFIWTYSEPDQGSTFKIYLPKAEEGLASEIVEQSHAIVLGGSETILIVEDNDSLRKLARNVLHEKGYKILAAENGENALDVSEAHNGSIELIITDVVMPKMNGEEVVKQLQLVYPHMKVIYMSGYTDNAIVSRGVLAPGINFLQKPFTPGELARKVREILDAEQ